MFRLLFLNYFGLRFGKEIRVVEFFVAEVEIFLDLSDLFFQTLDLVGEIDESGKRDVERAAFYERACCLFVGALSL